MAVMVDLEKAVVVMVIVLVILVDLVADVVLIVAVLKTLMADFLKVGIGVGGMIFKELITRAESTTPAALWVLGTMHLVIIFIN